MKTQQNHADNRSAKKWGRAIITFAMLVLILIVIADSLIPKVANPSEKKATATKFETPMSIAIAKAFKIINRSKVNHSALLPHLH